MDYSNEPEHSPLLNIQARTPFNAEPAASALVEFPLTPEDLVYCRNHGPVREFDQDTYVLTIKGGPKDVKLTVKELRSTFPKVQVVSALQVRPEASAFLNVFMIIFSVLDCGAMRWAASRRLMESHGLTVSLPIVCGAAFDSLMY